MNILKRKTQVIVIGIPVLIALALAGYLIFLKYQETKRLSDPAQATQKDVENIIKSVGKLILLPQGETPTIATVSDITKLKDQPFFANAQNGDRVLIYQAAKKAILYRPSENKIIDVAPVNVGQGQDATQSGNAATPEAQSVSFVLLNGTSVTGLTKKFEITLKERLPNAVIVERANTEGDYDTSVIVDVSGTKRAQAQTLAQALGLSVSSLPESETITSKSDFVIILGKDIAGPGATSSATPSAGQ